MAWGIDGSSVGPSQARWSEPPPGGLLGVGATRLPPGRLGQSWHHASCRCSASLRWVDVDCGGPGAWSPTRGDARLTPRATVPCVRVPTSSCFGVWCSWGGTAQHQMHVG